MKCFELREEIVAGIQPVEYENDMFFQIGVGPATIIPLGKLVRDALSELKADNLPWRLGVADFSSDGESIVRETKPECRWRWQEDRRALVLVQTAAGCGTANGEGKLIFSARSFTERVSRKGKVVKEYHPFVTTSDDTWLGQPMTGIEIVAAGCGPNGEPNALLVMREGASFRIYRTGDVGDAPREINVKWTGKMLTKWARGRYPKDRSHNQKAA